MGNDETLTTVVGAGALSYESGRAGSLENLIIYGDADVELGALGVYNSKSKRYETSVRVHGRSFMGGEEFYSLLTLNIGTYLTHSLTESILNYSYSSLPSNAYIIKPGEPPFKKNTVYTFRFHYVGEPMSSTGIKIRYEDGSSEDILCGTSSECNIAYPSAEGKTVYAIEASSALSGSGSIDLSSFGIFEGLTEYEDFSEYSGSVYTVSTSSALAGITYGDGGVFDVFDWKTKYAKYNACCASITNSRLYLDDGSIKPIIIKLQLVVQADHTYPKSIFHNYTRVQTYDELKKKTLHYMIMDGKNTYLSTTSSTSVSNYKKFFTTPVNYIYKRRSPEQVAESAAANMPSVEAGYVGIEVFGGIIPSKIKAYFKN